MRNNDMNNRPNNVQIIIYGDGNQVADSITNTYNGETYNGKHARPETQPKPKKATREMMSRAALITLRQGYWKAQRSWSVVFVVYGIWGYKGTVSEFVEEVAGWPDGVASSMLCNRDAVEKPKNAYNFTKDITQWRSNGVPEQYCILGEHLDEELLKLSSMAD